MRKITLLVFLLLISSFAFAEISVTNSAELATALVDATDGETINLAAGTYYPPQVTMTFADYWTDNTGATTTQKTFNAFVVPEKDITISGASTSTVIFDRNSVVNNDWQMAFVFFSDGDDTDGTGITFENFTVQNLDYGLVNSWALTKNYITSPTKSYMEYTRFDGIDFVDITQSGIIIEPRFRDGSKGSNNTDLFSSTHYNWDSLGNYSWTAGYSETASRCEIYNCNFNEGGGNGNNFNKAMANDVGVIVDLNNCLFEKGWRGFHMYGGGTGAAFTEKYMLITNCTFQEFDGNLYSGITANDNLPPEGYDWTENNVYWTGRGYGCYYQASDIYATFSGNYYQALNGATGVYTDGLKGESSTDEIYNYIGTAGVIKDLHNVRSSITLENSTFYIYNHGIGVYVTKHGVVQRTNDLDVNPYNSENYDYLGGYGTLDDVINVDNCNFYGTNVVNSIPGGGCGIFIEDWEHHDRDRWGVSDAARQGEVGMRVTDCIFQALYAGICVDAGRPDNLWAEYDEGEDEKLCGHDDGRLQLYVKDSKYIDCTYSMDFSCWDQWVRTNSWIMMEDNYFGSEADPYTTFNFATDFPAEDSYYELDNSAVRNTEDITQIVSYIYGQGATQRTYTAAGSGSGSQTETADNYHVYLPQYLQYLPYYKDEAMTQKSGIEVENLTISRVGNVYTLDWDDNANPNAKYAVYAADDPYTDNWGTIVATVSSSTYDYNAESSIKKYFKVGIIIPNLSKGSFYGGGLLNVSYEEPIDFGFPDPVQNHEIYTSTFNTLDFEYADDASYAVTKAGFMKKTLTYTGSNHNFISLPFTGNYGSVADLATYLGLTTDDGVSNWNESTQGWQSASHGAGSWGEDFDPVVNESYFITAGSAHDIYMYGAIPESPTYDLVTVDNNTNLNFIMIPLDSDLTTAAELGTEMGHNNAVMISQWDAANQNWNSCVYLETFTAWINSFEIDPGMPIVIGAEQNFTWPQ